MARPPTATKVPPAAQVCSWLCVAVAPTRARG